MNRFETGRGEGRSQAMSLRDSPEKHSTGRRVAAVVVTFFPELAQLSQKLGQILDAGADSVIVVDNTDGLSEQSRVATIVRAAGCQYWACSANVGIAAAQNAGLRLASASGARLAILLDQDTPVIDRLVVDLVAAWDREEANVDRLAAIGPALFDHRDGLTLVPEFARLGPKMRTTALGAEDVARVPFLVSSGTLLDISRWRAVGPFREDYFIDHVDYEWGLRATLEGYSLLVIGSIAMPHELAQMVPTRSGRLHRVPRQPSRRYYSTRNYILMLRDLRLPWAWRLGIACELVKAIMRSGRPARGALTGIGYAFDGLRDGLGDRRGPLQTPRGS